MLDVKDKVSIECADPAIDIENVAMEINEGPTPSCQVKLYDSGTTCHISPYCEHFENLVDIPNKSFTATNHQKFVMTGVGDMIVKVPMSMTYQDCILPRCCFHLRSDILWC